MSPVRGLLSARAEPPMLSPQASSPSCSSEAKPMLMTNKGREARLHYMPGTFRVLTPGDHVRCAITGDAIPLDELRYWSVERQEAYSSAYLSVQAEKRG